MSWKDDAIRLDDVIADNPELMDETQLDNSDSEDGLSGYVPQKISSWKDRAIHENELESTEEPTNTDDLQEEPSIQEALGRGALQGATAGFSDEILAAVRTPYELVKNKIAEYIPGTPESVDKQLREQGFKGDVDKSILQKTIDQYRELRGSAREANVAAEEAYPAAYISGELVGGIAPAFASGGTSAIASLGKTGLAQAAKVGAAYGAAYGAGESEADLTKASEQPQQALEFAKDVGQGAAGGAIVGGAMEKLLPIAGKAIGGAKNLVGEGLEKVGKSMPTLGKPLESVGKFINEDLRLDKAIDYIKSKTGVGLNKIMKATSDAYEGKEVIGPKVIEENYNIVLNGVKNLVDRGTTMRQLATKDITEAVGGAPIPAKNMVNKVEQVIADLRAKAPDEESQKITNGLQDALDNLTGNVKHLPNKEEAEKQLSDKFEFAKAFAEKEGFPPPSAIESEKGLVSFREYDPESQLPILKKENSLRYRSEKANDKVEISPQQILDFQKYIKDLTPESGATTSAMKGLSDQIRNSILESLPKEQADKMANGFKIWQKSYDIEDYLGKHILDPLVKGAEAAPKNKAILALVDKVMNMTGFDTKEMLSAQQQKIKQGVETLKQTLELSNQAKPEQLQQMMNSMQEAAARADIAGGIQASGEHALGTKKTLTGGGISALTRVGATIGHVAGGIKNIAESKPVKSLAYAGIQKLGRNELVLAAEKLDNKSPDQLKELATKMRTNPQYEKFADMLEGIADKPNNTRQAMLFTLQQQPAFREIIKQLEPKEETK